MFILGRGSFDFECFFFRESGKKKINKKDRAENASRGCFGTLESSIENRGEEVYYNPFKTDSFLTVLTEKKVTKAKNVKFTKIVRAEQIS